MILKRFKYFEKFSFINEDIKKLDRPSANKIRRCFMYISNNYGFFADLLFKLKIREASPNSGVDTMATDGKSISYCPAFVNNMTEPECAWVLLHEVLHNANFHFMRQGNRKAIVVDNTGKKHTLWNFAADYSINLQLEELTSAHIKRPNNVLFDKKYEDMSAEKIYDILYKETPNKEDGDDGDGEDGEDGDGEPGEGQGQGKPKPGQGKPKPGQGQGGQGKPEGLDGDIRAPGSLDGKGEDLYEGSEELEGAKGSEIDKTWGEILSDAKSKNHGTGSPSLDRWFNKIGKPKVNWKRMLLKFMNQCFASDPKYGYFNKKFIGGGDYLPGMKYPKTEGFRTIVLIIDTSGSISQSTLTKFASEFYGIFTTKKIEEAIIIWCDDRVQKVERIKTKSLSGASISKSSFEEKFLQKLKPSGAGGTSFIPPFKWIEKELINKTGVIPSFAIYFTDAAGDAPEPNKYSIPLYFKKVLWVITDTMTAPHIKFPEKIFLDKNPE